MVCLGYYVPFPSKMRKLHFYAHADVLLCGSNYNLIPHHTKVQQEIVTSNDLKATGDSEGSIVLGFFFYIYLNLY